MKRYATKKFFFGLIFLIILTNCASPNKSDDDQNITTSEVLLSVLQQGFYLQAYNDWSLGFQKWKEVSADLRFLLAQTDLAEAILEKYRLAQPDLVPSDEVQAVQFVNDLSILEILISRNEVVRLMDRLQSKKMIVTSLSYYAK